MKDYKLLLNGQAHMITWRRRQEVIRETHAVKWLWTEMRCCAARGGRKDLPSEPTECKTIPHASETEFS